jgi:hypothetical protein
MFQKGNSGRPKGTKNKIKPQSLSDFLVKNNLNLSQEIWTAIMNVDNPAFRAKLLIDLYKYIEAPKTAQLDEPDQPEQEHLQVAAPSEIMRIVGPE